MYIILVSYRARGIQSFRRNQLMETLDNFKTYFEKNNTAYKIVITEQNNDGKFNRGLLLNAAFLESEKAFTFDKKYIHMNADYRFNLSKEIPSEFSTVKGFLELFRALYPYPHYLGSACVFDAESYLTINGFPNDLEGWGGDDWAILNRINSCKINVITPPHLINSGFILEEFVHFHNDTSNNVFNIELSRRDDIQSNGLTTIKYNVDGYGEFNGENVLHLLIN
jgi:hypothetical protein